MTSKFGYVTTACRLSEVIVPPDANLSITSQGVDLNLLIYAPKVNMYLCFTKRWKLRGKRFTREEAIRIPRCQFRELMNNGYTQFQSSADPSYYIGFRNGGRPMGLPYLDVPSNRRKCFDFLKEDSHFSISGHNSKLGGETFVMPNTYHNRPTRRRHQQPCPEPLRHARSRHLRKRKYCDNT